MRLFRVLLVALLGVFAVVAGLITAAAVSLATAVVVTLRRMLRGQTPLPARRPQRVARPASGEVIDVTATEVPVDAAHR
jgi:hypothetical protein